MLWYTYIAYFFAGVLLANGVPHFVHGISGKRFSSPFAEPPEGKSSAVVNVVWGMGNFVVGYALIVGVGKFAFGFTIDALMVGIGAVVTSIGLAWQFGRR